MQVQEIMTTDPVCVQPETSLEAVAQMMVEYDCGAIPVCDTRTEKVVGILTDRDIVVRTVAKGLDPLEMLALDAMTNNPHTLKPNASVDDCIRMMEEYKIRRVPVTDEQEKLLGMVSQADIVRRVIANQPQMTEEFEEALEEISEPKMSV
jgi:CBS domain-containing protein